jgi:hypothetical protein
MSCTQCGESIVGVVYQAGLFWHPVVGWYAGDGRELAGDMTFDRGADDG